MSKKNAALLGAHRISLVGRDEIISKILRIINLCKSPTIVYLQGEGGVGKTAILEEIIDLLREKNEETDQFIVADRSIDLYHVEYQSRIGFAKAVSTIYPGHEHEFSHFRQLLLEAEEQFKNHNPNEGEELIERSEKEFINAINLLCKKSTVLLPLDTVERFEQYRANKSNVENWIFAEILPSLRGRIILLLAGRAEDEQGNKSNIVKDIEPLLIKRTWKLVDDPQMIGPLSKESSEEYFRQVAADIEKEDLSGSTRILNYLKQNGIDDLYYQSQGKPLRLAILADILRVGGNVSWLKERLKPSEISSERADKELTRHLIEITSGNIDTPIGEILRHMAYLPRGVNALLLSRVMHSQEIKTNKWLEQASKLTIVKVRQDTAGNRYFLHDEMYRVFGKYMPPTDEERHDIHISLTKYYDEQLENLEAYIKESADPTGYIKQRQRVVVEKIHYDIWAEPVSGYANFFVREGDAIENPSSDFAQSLQNEARRTIQEIPDIQVRNLLNNYFEQDIYLREAEKALFDGKLSTAKELLTNLHSSILLHPLYQAYRDLNRGILQYKSNNLPESEREFNKAEETLELMNHDNIGQSLAQAKDYAKGLIANYRSLIERKQGRHPGAVAHAKKAALFLRGVKTDNLSGVLINDAYATAMTGQERTARSIAQEALEAAERAGNDLEKARVYNLKTFIESRVPDFEQAKTYGERALKIISKLKKTRPVSILEGYVQLNLSRAYRYRWNNHAANDEYSEWVASLAQGLSYIEGSHKVRDELNLSSEFQLDDCSGCLALLQANKHSYVEALNEAGCHWREIAWASNHLGNESLHRVAYRTATGYFMNAAGIKSKTPEEEWINDVRKQIYDLDKSPYWPALALSNLGWHLHYSKETSEKIKSICDLVDQIIGDEYLWHKDGSAPNLRPEGGEIMRWAVLGKTEMLRCHQYLRDRKLHEGDKRIENIVQAAKHATLSLEYNYYMGRSTYDLRRAEENILHRIRQSKNWEKELLPPFYKGVSDFSKTLKTPTGRIRLIRMLQERFGPLEFPTK